jgi:hypothetical protein
MSTSSVPPAADPPAAGVPAVPAVPAALAAELAGLPETDRTRILTVIAANHAPTTLTIYAHAWRQWTAWCAGRAIPSRCRPVRAPCAPT